MSNTPTSTGRRGYVAVDRRWLADPNLSDSALRLMLWLESHTDEYLAAMNMSKASDALGWSRNRIKRTVTELEALGLVSTEQLPRQHGGTVTRFSLHLSVWSDGPSQTSDTETDGPPRTSAVVHGEARAVVHGGAPTTSTHSVVGTHSQEQCTNDVVRPSLELVRRDDDTERFEQFWQLYGRTGPKKKARECWNRARTKATADEIIDGLKRWVEYWSTPGAAAIKWPQGWLNEERWRDEPPFVALHIDRRNSQPQRDNGMGAIARRRQAQDR